MVKVVGKGREREKKNRFHKQQSAYSRTFQLIRKKNEVEFECMEFLNVSIFVAIQRLKLLHVVLVVLMHNIRERH